MPSPTKVLLLDDSPLVRERVRRVLTSGGYEVFAVSGFVEANHVYFHERPEVLLIDVNLGPLLKGNAVLAHYLTKETPQYSPALILYSDMDRDKLERLGQECGADGVIAKGDDLITALAVEIRKREAGSSSAVRAK